MNKLFKTIMLSVTLLISCNPFDFQAMFTETHECRIEVIGKDFSRYFIIKVPVKNYEEMKTWFEPYKYIQYFPDGTPDIFYKQYYNFLTIKNMNGGIKVDATGYGVAANNCFVINSFYDYRYDFSDMEYHDIIVNIID